MAATVQDRLMGAAVDATGLRQRFRAWWDGVDLKQPAAVAAVPAPEPVKAPPPMPRDPSVPYWSSSRIEVAQRVWGREHLGPGGEVYTRYLLKPLGLAPMHAVAEIGSGLGGAARLMHRSFGTWVKGFEPSAELAGSGMELSSKAGLTKKVQIAQIDLAETGIKRGTFDRIILRDQLHTVANKIALLRTLGDALKPKGLILLTDFTIEADRTPPVAVVDWAENEPIRSQAWSGREMDETLEDLKFQVQVTEDETAMLRQMILEGWCAFQVSLRGVPLTAEQKEAMFSEGERWSRCLAAIDSGALRYKRVVAARRA